MSSRLHVVLILSCVAAVLLLVLVAGMVLRPESFGEYGHFRWNAMHAMLERPVKAPGQAACIDCHSDILQLHEKDAHNGVPCVDCHGAGAAHVTYHRGEGDAAGISALSARMSKDYQLEGCLYCHRKLRARPKDFPQVDKDEHYRFLRVTDPSTPCISCHNPHEPIFLLTDARSARLHPIVSRCTDCHERQPDRGVEAVKNHPTIWQCRDCHASVVKSFEQRSHAGHLECRTCHLFHVEDERSGRMYKNGNAAFCLLCHEAAAFKDPAHPPKITWPAHLGPRSYLATTDQKTCLNCHWQNIHEMHPGPSASPHPASWTKDHRAYLKKHFEGRSEKAGCRDCHSASYCRDCHRVDLPHPDAFLSDHAATVTRLGVKTCQACHTTESCSTCHEPPR